MSIQYCHYCNKYIDTDFDAEHFDSPDDTECLHSVLCVLRDGRNDNGDF